MAVRVLEHIRIGNGGQLLGVSRKEHGNLPKYYLMWINRKIVGLLSIIIICVVTITSRQKILSSIPKPKHL